MTESTRTTLHHNRQLPWRYTAPDAMVRAWNRPLHPEAALLRRIMTDVRCDRRALAASLIAYPTATEDGARNERLVDALLALLPRHLPHLTGWEIAARYLPAEQVGGDFYDLVPLDDGRIGVLMGDVAGKGTAAAVVMAMARSILRTEVAGGESPAQVLQRANDAMVKVMPKGYFLTCLYLVLDPITGSLQIANAGHNLPYVQTVIGVSHIDVTGLPLGLLEGVEYEEMESVLPAAASVIFYSDGITEARNEERELFGFCRVRQIIAELPVDTAPACIAQSILSAVRAHTGAAPQEDDIALLVLKRH